MELMAIPEHREKKWELIDLIYEKTSLPPPRISAFTDSAKQAIT